MWLSISEGVVPVRRTRSQVPCCPGLRMKEMPGSSWPFLLPQEAALPMVDLAESVPCSGWA